MAPPSGSRTVLFAPNLTSPGRTPLSVCLRCHHNTSSIPYTYLTYPTCTGVHPWACKLGAAVLWCRPFKGPAASSFLTTKKTKPNPRPDLSFLFLQVLTTAPTTSIFPPSDKFVVGPLFARAARKVSEQRHPPVVVSLCLQSNVYPATRPHPPSAVVPASFLRLHLICATAAPVPAPPQLSGAGPLPTTTTSTSNCLWPSFNNLASHIFLITSHPHFYPLLLLLLSPPHTAASSLLFYPLLRFHPSTRILHDMRTNPQLIVSCPKTRE
jgi:hypothetical protein